MTRNKLVLAMVAVSTTATAARAQGCAGRPIEEVVASCDAAFDGDSLLTLSARGWCYLINAGRCTLV